MKKIVVTGATSMIGSALIEECVKHDIEVYAVLRSASGKQDRLPDSSLVHLIDSSLETLEELPELIPQGCDTFYHIAWGNTGENRNRSTELQSRNIGYTLAAVRAANALGCKRFIGAGSQAEYGPMDVERISPDSPTNPSTPYGASKLASGHLAGMLCRELGMECIWPRIFSVYGIHGQGNDDDRFGTSQDAEGRTDRIYAGNAAVGLSVQQGCRPCLLPDR